VAAVPAARVTISRVRTADGSVATFRGPVHYVLHNGSQDPGPAAAGLVPSGRSVPCGVDPGLHHCPGPARRAASGTSGQPAIPAVTAHRPVPAAAAEAEMARFELS